MKNFILNGFIGAILLLISPASLSAADFTESGDATIIIRKGEHGASEVYKRETKFVEDFYSGFDQAKLYKVITETNYNLASEGYQEVSTVTAYNVQEGPSYGQVLWAGKFNGGDFALFSDELVKVTVSGCCGAPNENYLINKENGVVAAMTHDDSGYILQVPNTQHALKYIGKTFEEDAPSSKDGKTYIGSVIYFSKNKILNRARIYADLPDGWGTDLTELEIAGENVEVQGNLVNLWGSDGQKDASIAFSGVSLRGKLYYADQTESFEIAIFENRISRSQSKKSRGLSLEIL